MGTCIFVYLVRYQTSSPGGVATAPAEISGADDLRPASPAAPVSDLTTLGM